MKKWDSCFIVHLLKTFYTVSIMILLICTLFNFKLLSLFTIFHKFNTLLGNDNSTWQVENNNKEQQQNPETNRKPKSPTIPQVYK